MTKKKSENERKMNGTRNQPMARKVARNAISIGKVTQHSVMMTIRGDGGGFGGVLMSKLSEEAEGSPENGKVVA